MGNRKSNAIEIKFRNMVLRNGSSVTSRVTNIKTSFTF